MFMYGEHNQISKVEELKSVGPGPVLLKSGHGGVITERRGDFLKKRQRIAVAWRVSNGGAMAVMAAWQKIAFFFGFFRGRSWADPTHPYSVT